MRLLARMNALCSYRLFSFLYLFCKLLTTSFAWKMHSLPVHQRLTYRHKQILAPMVRISTLPFRLECLKYGADIVFSEELVDKKLLSTVRVYNPTFNIVEYVSTKDNTVVFSTSEEERSRVVLQLGTANPQLALQAAKMLIDDVAGIDVNMGCPKSFSVKGGMGAALLKTPELAASILTTLTANLDKPVTCKIRLLDTLEKTIQFAKMCESCGIAALTIHMRTERERPSHRAHWDLFLGLKSALSIPVVANGDLLNGKDIEAFQTNIGAESLMFARGAMFDPSIFIRNTTQNSPSKKAVCQSFIRRAIECRAVFQSIKFILQEMLSQDHSNELKESLQSCRSLTSICKLFDMTEYCTSLNYELEKTHSLQYYKENDYLTSATQCAYQNTSPIHSSDAHSAQSISDYNSALMGIESYSNS